MSKNRFYFFKDYVTSGKSKLFNSLHDLLGIELDDFLENLKWLLDDPFDEKGRITRDSAFQLDGKIIRLKRTYAEIDGSSPVLHYADGSIKDSLVVYRNLDGTLFNNILTVYMMNSREGKMTFDTEIVINYPKNVELYVDNYKDYTPREILLHLDGGKEL